MMDHAIAEVGREDLPKLGLFDDETDRTRGMVGPPFQFLVQLQQVLLQPRLKPEGVVGGPLVSPAPQILPVQILERKQRGHHAHHAHTRQSWCWSCCWCSRCHC